MRKKKSVLDFNTRRKIYEAIFDNPGIHLRRLSRNINIPLTTLNYHLKVLKKNDLIIEDFYNKQTRFFISNNIGVKERKVINLLRHETPRNIILMLFHSLCLSNSEISEALEKHPNTIYFHLKKLLEFDVIEPAPEVDEGYVFILGKESKILKRKHVCNEVVYRLKDMQNYFKIVYLYENCLITDIPSKSVFSYIKSCNPKAMPKKINSDNNALDSLIDLFNSYFPSSFCA